MAKFYTLWHSYGKFNLEVDTEDGRDVVLTLDSLEEVQQVYDECKAMLEGQWG